MSSREIKRGGLDARSQRPGVIAFRSTLLESVQSTSEMEPGHTGDCVFAAVALLAGLPWTVGVGRADHLQAFLAADSTTSRIRREGAEAAAVHL